MDSYVNKLFSNMAYTGTPVAFKTWWGQQYMVGIICLPPIGIGLRWQQKLGVDTSPRPHAYRRACTYLCKLSLYLVFPYSYLIYFCPSRTIVCK